MAIPAFILLTGLISPLSIVSSGEIFEEIEVVERREVAESRYLLYGADWLEGETLRKFGFSPSSLVSSTERGGFGVQQDLSIAGSTFEQNLLLFEGLRISDLQTGHHLMNLPFAPYDISGVEFLTGGISALYGQGGFGGALNYFLEPSRRGYLLRFGLGSYDLKEGFIRLGLPVHSKVLTLSLNYRASLGHTTNRDFDMRSLNFYHKDDRGLIYYGFSERDFGARYFYTPRFDSEWESVRTHLFALKRSFNWGSFFFDPGFLFRRNYDYYVLFRNEPERYGNRHRSTLYRVNLPVTLLLPRGLLHFGLELGYESLVSSRLGSYMRKVVSPFLTWETPLSERTLALLTMRYDQYLREKDITTLSSSILYMLREGLTLRFSVYGTSRLPSVTELRYEALGIKGNPELLPERVLGLELSLEAKIGGGRLRFLNFFRKGYDLIDWFNNGSGTSARNIDTDTLGFSVEYRRDLKGNKLWIGYTYLHQKGQDLLFSRYLGNYLRHNFWVGLALNLPQGWLFAPGIGYQKRFGQKGTALVDFTLEKRLAEHLTFYLWGKNLLNERYYELRYHEAGVGVEGIPRWFGAGLRIGY